MVFEKSLFFVKNDSFRSFLSSLFRIFAFTRRITFALEPLCRKAEAL